MPTSAIDETPPAEPEAVRSLVVPGSEVAIHWLELAEGLTEAQAAAAARLMLADASAEPLSEMHVAVGRPERGLTPVALAPKALMAQWVASDPDLIVPSPFLLRPPAEGLVRRETESVPDYRGEAAAFSVEPELAALVVGDAPVREIGEAEYEAGLAEALADPALNLRQGMFARRRQWRLDRGAARRVAWLVVAFVAASLVLQVATILRYSFAADRLEAEAAALAASAPPGAESRPGLAPLASVLFAAVRATPNVELVRVDYRPDGSLSALVTTDGAATLDALRRNAEASGARIEVGPAQSGGARPGNELVLRPA